MLCKLNSNVPECNSTGRNSLVFGGNNASLQVDPCPPLNVILLYSPIGRLQDFKISRPAS